MTIQELKGIIRPPVLTRASKKNKSKDQDGTFMFNLMEINKIPVVYFASVKKIVTSLYVNELAKVDLEVECLFDKD